MNRRGFLQSMLTLAAAPAIVRADSLMSIVPRETGVLTLEMIDALHIELQVAQGLTLHEIIRITLQQRAPLLRANLMARNPVYEALR